MKPSPGTRDGSDGGLSGFRSRVMVRDCDPFVDPVPWRPNAVTRTARPTRPAGGHLHLGALGGDRARERLLSRKAHCTSSVRPDLTPAARRPCGREAGRATREEVTEATRAGQQTLVAIPSAVKFSSVTTIS